MSQPSKADYPLEILLVEDSPGAERMAVQALQSSTVPNNLRVLRNGIEALSFLRRSGEYAMAPEPDLIILDLNRPRISGPAVLAEIRQDPDLKDIPTVLVTTGESGPELFENYGLRMDDARPRPVDLERYMRVVQTIALWFAFSKPPLETRKVGLMNGNTRVY